MVHASSRVPRGIELVRAGAAGLSGVAGWRTGSVGPHCAPLSGGYSELQGPKLTQESSWSPRKTGFAAIEKPCWKRKLFLFVGHLLCIFLGFAISSMERSISDAGKNTQLGLDEVSTCVPVPGCSLRPPSLSEVGLTGDELFQTKEQLAALRSADCCLK